MKIYIVWYDDGEFGEKNIVIDSAWSDPQEAEKRKNFLWGMYADISELDLDNLELKRTEFTGMIKKLPLDMSFFNQPPGSGTQGRRGGNNKP